MKSFELTAAITAAANLIACDMTLGELALTASILVQLGDTLATIAAERALCEEAKESLE